MKKVGIVLAVRSLAIGYIPHLLRETDWTCVDSFLGRIGHGRGDGIETI